VDRLDAHPRAAQDPLHAVRAVPRPCEHEGVFDLLVGQERFQELGLGGLFHVIQPMVDVFGGRGNGSDLDPDRITEQGARKADDLRRHRGGEHQGLPLRGKFLDDAADVEDEPHVQHPVRLVQDEDLDGGQVDEPLSHQVEETAGRGDEDIHPFLQRLLLGPLADAAVDDGVPHSGVAAVGGETFPDLHGQFPCRREDKGPDDPASPDGPAPPGETVKDRQRESGRLSCAGLRRAQEVFPLEDAGDRLLLDGGWDRVVHFLNGPEDLRG
jgi:hypothetical protein